MEQQQRRRQQPQPQNQELKVQAGEGPERTEHHDYGEWKGWHEKPLPDGGNMIIVDGF